MKETDGDWREEIDRHTIGGQSVGLIGDSKGESQTRDHQGETPASDVADVSSYKGIERSVSSCVCRLSDP